MSGKWNAPLSDGEGQHFFIQNIIWYEFTDWRYLRILRASYTKDIKTGLLNFLIIKLN
jgi:hypothetical protein